MGASKISSPNVQNCDLKMQEYLFGCFFLLLILWQYHLKSLVLCPVHKLISLFNIVTTLPQEFSLTKKEKRKKKGLRIMIVANRGSKSNSYLFFLLIWRKSEGSICSSCNNVIMETRQILSIPIKQDIGYSTF